ncbi:MAG: phosphoribosylformylglycinamidine synthase subunit PurL [Planctomycetaceae bacterium]|nr:phosphoribosylformylglycinamidine synthase subunit PurL [Planctomycetaceae bacterium]
MLWEVEILPSADSRDHEGQRVLADARSLGIESLSDVRSARSFLIQGELTEADASRAAGVLLCDGVVEQFRVKALPETDVTAGAECLNVLLHPGVTDSVAENAARALTELELNVTAVATCRKYWLTGDLSDADQTRVTSRVLANDAIEYVVAGPLQLEDLSVGSRYDFQLGTVPIRSMDSDEQLMKLSAEGQLYLQLAEMQTIRDYFKSLDRDPTDIELETVAQTWSEHCSHKTLAGRIHYVESSGSDTVREIQFDNMLKETIFQATVDIRDQLGDDDWCVSVFKDNAGIVRFDENQDVCIKVETHNHPSAIEPYGGANTGLGGVIRDPMGTGLGARPVCNTDVFCFARPDFPAEELPPGVLHPKAVMEGVVSGVRDYGNRMGIPTVNGAVYFDDRYLGNPLVYCGNVAMIPRDKSEGKVSPGDMIVAVGGRTGRDGIHGATFSSAELTEDSESISGGAVQIGNPVTEKMVLDVLLEARERNLYTAITDCGAGGFSSAVGEMGEDTGAEVWLEKAPLKYSGLSYTEIWISEAQERMVLAVPAAQCDEFQALCASEGVEASVIGQFTDTHELVLKYQDNEVGRLTMDFLHDGRPPVIREATFDVSSATAESDADLTAALAKTDLTSNLLSILGSLNVASKEWIIRQYDHEVQSGSVVKPLVGVNNDGPSDAAVVRPDLTSNRGLVVSCGMNPHLGDADPYWMAASAIDESIRNCVAVGADPSRIAILDNFCWGNTERAETLGTLVRAALGCQDVAIAYGTPFVSGKDSLNNEFSYDDRDGNRQTVAIPSTLLITALGQIDHVEQAVTMDLKAVGNPLYLVGDTNTDEFAGSHFCLVNNITGGTVPQVDLQQAPAVFRGLHAAMQTGAVKSCHDLSEGGLAVAAAEMAFAGGIGMHLTGVTPALAFAESNTRFLVEVAADQTQAFEAALDGVPLLKVGSTTETTELVIESDARFIAASLTDLKEAWQAPLRY